MIKFYLSSASCCLPKKRSHRLLEALAPSWYCIQILRKIWRISAEWTPMKGWQLKSTSEDKIYADALKLYPWRVIPWEIHQDSKKALKVSTKLWDGGSMPGQSKWNIQCRQIHPSRLFSCSPSTASKQIYTQEQWRILRWRLRAIEESWCPYRIVFATDNCVHELVN